MSTRKLRQRLAGTTEAELQRLRRLYPKEAAAGLLGPAHPPPEQPPRLRVFDSYQAYQQRTHHTRCTAHNPEVR